MDRATRILAVAALTQKDTKARTTAVTKLAPAIADQQFGRNAATVVSKTEQAFVRVVTHHAELLDLLAESIDDALDSADQGDLAKARANMVSNLPLALTNGKDEVVAKLTSKGLSPPLKRRLDTVLDDLRTSLDKIRSNIPVTSPTRDSSYPMKVAVFGAGIAGLTAAHELAERGFDVTVYEKAPDERKSLGSHVPPVKLGGMAASHHAYPPGAIPVSGEEAVQDGSTAAIRPFPTAWVNGWPIAADYPDELPGEHGFRFFPAYYLHIWDMLQRIPIVDYDLASNSWLPTPRTVFDNIQRVVTQATTTPAGRPSVVFPREAPRSVAEFLGGLGQLRELGFSPSDVSTFTSRLARYLATSPTRRAREFEDISAYEFFVGAEPTSARPMYDYSSAFDDQLRNMPKVLAAFDGFYGDARTNLSTYLQLQLRMDRRDNKADGVLRGPTSESWFDHWYRHLSERLGVKFRRWELDQFQLGSGSPPALEAVGQDPSTGSAEIINDAIYYVVALDAPHAEKVVKTLALPGGKVGGTVSGLQGWTTDKPLDTPPVPDTNERGPARAPASEVGLVADQRAAHGAGLSAYNMQQLGLQPWDRYQTLSGLQFYFDTEFQLVHGHMYYTDSIWGLSSINHHGLWEATHRPTIPADGFVSVLSVDIGDWNTPSPAVPEPPDPSRPSGKAAKDCSPDELAEEVWRQIKTSLRNDMPDRVAQTFPTPLWYTLDRSFVVETNAGEQRIVENLAPYLVPIVSDWQNRPGGDPWNPHHTSLSYRRTETGRAKDAEEGVWAAEHGGYQVHCDQLVFAGTWTRTFTRMTSMEAACESGRHAVNAILDHLIHAQIGDERGDDVGLRWMWPFDFLDQSGSGPIRQPTPVGDYCYIFDIENREPAEFRPTRRLDREFAAMGQPHPWELGGVDAMIRTAAAGGSGAMIDPAMPLNPYSKGFFDWVVGHLKSYRQFLESLDLQTSSSGFPGASWTRRYGDGDGGSDGDSGSPFDPLTALNRITSGDAQFRVVPPRDGSQHTDSLGAVRRLRLEGPLRNLRGRDFP